MLLFHKELSRLWDLRLLGLYLRNNFREPCSWEPNWIKDIRPAAFCEAFGKRPPVQSVASLNGIRADESSAQWLTVFYWVSLMHGTMESNNLQLRSHLRYGWPILTNVNTYSRPQEQTVSWMCIMHKRVFTGLYTV